MAESNNRLGCLAFLMILIVVVGGIFFATNGTFSTLSCKQSSNQTPTGIPPQREPSPIIKSFSAIPSMIVQGQTTKLSWDVSDATSISIDQGIGSVFLFGTQVISPTTTTTYTLTATNGAGSATASAIVTVTAASQPVITSFIANPTTITAGQYSTLQWSVTGATSISIDQGIGTVPSSGTHIVSPSTSITYTLTATSSYGSVTASATITSAATSTPVITSFTANPTTITAGQYSTLQWSVTGATSVTSVTLAPSLQPVARSWCTQQPQPPTPLLPLIVMAR